MQDVVKDILGKCGDAAKTMAAKEAKAFLSDATAFLNKTKDDLQKWALQFEQGEIDADDLEWLIDMKKDLAEMQALKRKGIARIRTEELQNQMLSIVTTAISSAV
jgi:hypothetical protein